MKICHITSIHSPIDVRIFLKEATSLAAHGYDVHLVAPGSSSVATDPSKDNDTDQANDVYHFHSSEPPSQEIFEEQGVTFHNVERASGGRLARMTRTTWSVYRSAQAVDADLYHFHDPELIPIGLLLKAQGRHVVRDVHENLPEQILSKHWVPTWLRRSLATISRSVEAFSAHFFDGIIAATPAIGRRFPSGKTAVVQNFPLQSELTVVAPIPYEDRPGWITFVGGISEIRGIYEMLKAIDILDCSGGSENQVPQLRLAGAFRSSELELEAMQMPGWKRTKFLGWQSRQDMADLLARSRMGLVLYHPMPNHVDAQPNKLFEYMSAGVPIVASDFPLWREIVENERCGIMVDPLNPAAIAEAMQWIFDHPQEAAKMGERGQRAVATTYNWESQVAGLFTLYADILTPTS